MSDPGYTDYDAVVRVFENMKLSNSGYADDAVNAMLRNTASNSLETHAPIFLKGEAEDGLKKVVKALGDLPPGTKVILLAGAVVVVGGAVAIGKNWDSIKTFSTRVVNRFRPNKAVISKVSELDAIEIDIQVPSASLETSPQTTDIEVVEGETEIVLSLDEWRNLFRSALALNSFEEQIWLLLSRATIEAGDDRTLTWQRQMRELPKDEFLQLVKEAIEAVPQQQDDEVVTEVMKVLIRHLGRGEEEQKPLE
ncbi:hypothetical protein [Leucobacter sp. G161]|uniref:hypothetical protein n=1 Tax=Leucobacter sp. G161 TaxID=663704 RepID=UPI00073C1A73|nr:hypothetical protein [Leucobacter sp. G161]KUF06938.1 hypothetical protein AUL38_10710 [Leucobacter sp. G161]